MDIFILMWQSVKISHFAKIPLLHWKCDIHVSSDLDFLYLLVSQAKKKTWILCSDL